MATCHFAAPGAVIASLPATLGFVPQRSLVLAAFTGDQISAVLRADLGADLIDGLDQIAATAALSGADSVTAVVVDADGALCPMCRRDYRELCGALAAALDAEQIDLRGAHLVDLVASGGRWHCLSADCDASGEVPDPQASPASAAAVLAGRRLYKRREDIEATLQISDPERTARLAKVIAGCANGVSASAVPAAAQAAAALLAANGDLADMRIAGLVLALGDGTARDGLYSLAIDPCAGTLENLWAFLVRTTPDPWRVEVLVLLGFFAFARGDGPLAGMALDAALGAAPDHRMAQMLDCALRSGVRPEDIRVLAAGPRGGQ